LRLKIKCGEDLFENNEEELLDFSIGKYLLWLKIEKCSILI
jgi:hypothetical protein